MKHLDHFGCPVSNGPAFSHHQSNGLPNPLDLQNNRSFAQQPSMDHHTFHHSLTCTIHLQHSQRAIGALKCAYKVQASLCPGSTQTMLHKCQSDVRTREKAQS